MPPQVCDFGLSNITRSGSAPPKAKSFVGTTAYSAPEQLKQPLVAYDMRPAELWSIGIIVYVA